MAEYSLSVVCARALGDAAVWRERGRAPMDGLVNVATDGSRDGHQVGWAGVVVSYLSVVPEAWFGCAMVGAYSLVDEWCGKAAALWLLGVLGVPLLRVRSFVADNRGATYGEDSGHASHCPCINVLPLRTPC